MKVSSRALCGGLGVAVVVAALWAAKTPPRLDAAAAPDVVRPRAAAAGIGIGIETGAVLTRRELTQQSDVIIVGRATESRSAWTPDGRILNTIVSVAVEETLKGDGAAALTVALPGGIDANRKFPIAMTYPGAPQIGATEAVVLFLVGGDDVVPDALSVTGFNQGKFSIQTAAPAPGARGVGARYVRVGGQLVPLDAFTAEIRSYVSQ